MRSNRTIFLVGASLALLAGCNKGESTKAVSKPKVVVKAPKRAIDPDAIAALNRMSAFLVSLKTAEIQSNGSVDVVSDEGQRIQLDGTTSYKVRKPGFVIDFDSDLKKRRFFYDGKTFTEYSPTVGFYASTAAPPSNREALDVMYTQYGIKLPLEDLFRWSDPAAKRDDSVTSAYQVGTATIDGVETDHYAFREGSSDWEVWIQQGAQPLPRKMVIVDTSRPERPTFIARLDWKVNPPLTDPDFTFTPDANDKRIAFAKYEQPGT